MRLLEIIGLQGAIADGSENTFDEQPMQRGTHLRWGFAPELGFPAGGFWLCRRKSEGQGDIAAREGHLLPPEGWQQLCRRSLERQHDEREGRDDRGKNSVRRDGRILIPEDGIPVRSFVLRITVKQWLRAIWRSQYSDTFLKWLWSAISENVAVLKRIVGRSRNDGCGNGRAFSRAARYALLSRLRSSRSRRGTIIVAAIGRWEKCCSSVSTLCKSCCCSLSILISRAYSVFIMWKRKQREKFV